MKMLTKLLIAIVICDFSAGVTVQAGTHERGTQASTDPDWSELIAKHWTKCTWPMGGIQRTGTSDVDLSD